MIEHSVSAGARLGPYELLSRLGAGGMGEVWRARDARLQRDVAIKVLPAELSSDQSRLKRFEKEARSASALNHPNIVTIYDIGQSDSVSYIAMELVEGKTLREVLFAGPLPIKRVLPIAVQIAEGLAGAHEAGIVHRDLKPENVMVTKDGRVKILDFGLAKLTYTGGDSGEGTNIPTETGTGEGVVLGTVGYMSPEQASGQPVDYRSDQFSFGSILYELLTGKRAFVGKTGVDTLSAILNDEPASIAAINPQTPTPLRWIVERCLAKDPEERYGTTRDLARELASVRDHLSEISGATGTTEGSARRRTILLAAAIALAMLAAAGAIYTAVRGSRDARAADLRFQQITFRRGWIHSARFVPDDQTIVYGGQWEGRPPELFMSRIGSVESRSLGISPADVLSISSSGEMAVLYPLQDQSLGSLATASLAGGAPRAILENVTGASFAPDGKSLAVAYQVAGRTRLEFPIGRVLLETPNPIERVMVSPSGDRVAFQEDRTLVVVDRAGTRKKFRELRGAPAFDWSPRGDEIWYSMRPGDSSEFHAVDLLGRDRLLAAFAGIFVLHDVAADGRILVERGTERFSMFGRFGDSTSAVSLSWLDRSLPVGLSNDGKTLLFGDGGGGQPGPSRFVYVRSIDEPQAVPLGEGDPVALSPDGKWVLASTPNDPAALIVLPTGAGPSRKLAPGGFQQLSGGGFLSDGGRVWFNARNAGQGWRPHVQEIAGGRPRAILSEGMRLIAVSPDGRRGVVRVVGSEGRAARFVVPLEGGSENPIPALMEGEPLVRWSGDGKYLFTSKWEGASLEIHRLDLASDRRQLWKQIAVAEPIEPNDIRKVVLTPDGSSVVYAYQRYQSHLFLLEGLR